jgi:hypothetical protein
MVIGNDQASGYLDLDRRRRGRTPKIDIHVVEEFRKI